MPSPLAPLSNISLFYDLQKCLKRLNLRFHVPFGGTKSQAIRSFFCNIRSKGTLVVNSNHVFDVLFES